MPPHPTLGPEMIATAGDDELMGSAVAGDVAAFHALVDRYMDAIFRFVTRMVGPSVAEDLTQEVFLRAFERSGSYRARVGSFRSWLYGIARNTSVDHLRRRRRPPRDTDALAEVLADGAIGPGARLQLTEAHAKLEEALTALPEQNRTAFLLCAVEGLSYEEASAVLGCSVKTISSRLSRGRAQLQGRLERYLE